MSGSKKRTCPVARDPHESVPTAMPMEAFASIGFFVSSHLDRPESALCKQWRHRGAILTTAIT